MKSPGSTSVLALLISSAMFLGACSGLQTKDMQQYHFETEKLVKAGKYEQALERYIWFHKHALEHDKGMIGVRLSFELGGWVALGEVYPPARLALLKIRDQKTQELNDGPGSFPLFQDVAAINEYVGEGTKTLELFAVLALKHPAMAERYWIIAKDPALKAKRYDLARKYMGNLMREYSLAKDTYDSNAGLFSDPQVGTPEFRAYAEDAFVEQCLQLIDMALAFKDPATAKEIRSKAMKVVKDYRLEDALKH